MSDQNQTPDEGTEKDKVGVESSNQNSNEGGEAKETSQELKQPEVDYKKKFAESTRENQILASKVKETEKKLGEIAKNEIPAEEELKRLHPNWEEMSDLEKESTKKSLILERRLGKVEQEVRGNKEEKQWSTEVDHFLEKAKILDEYPGLEQRGREFKEFANMPTHKGVSPEVLAKAFLFKEVEAPPVVHKGSVLERGSGGEKIDLAPKKKLTAEELGTLRENDSKKYKEIITQHPDWLPDDIE